MYRIVFEDEGQDLTSLIVDDDGVIIDAGFHRQLYKGCIVTNLVIDKKIMQAGDFVTYYRPSTKIHNTFRYKVEKITKC